MTFAEVYPTNHWAVEYDLLRKDSDPGVGSSWERVYWRVASRGEAIELVAKLKADNPKSQRNHRAVWAITTDWMALPGAEADES